MGAVWRLPGRVTRKISPMTIATKKAPTIGRVANIAGSRN